MERLSWEEAKDYLIGIGYDVNYGARPLKRIVSRTLEVLLANALISGEISYGETITFDLRDNELVIR